MRVSELLDRPEKWTQRAMARDRGDWPIDFNDTGAVCWCLMGAMSFCHEGCGFISSYEKVFKIVTKRGYDSVTKWNDAKERTWGDVKALALEAEI